MNNERELRGGASKLKPCSIAITPMAGYTVNAGSKVEINGNVLNIYLSITVSSDISDRWAVRLTPPSGRTWSELLISAINEVELGYRASDASSGRAIFNPDASEIYLLGTIAGKTMIIRYSAFMPGAD